MENLAICKFCGQIIVKELPEGITREEAMEEGTLACGCEQARAYQRMNERADIAKAELKEMLLEDDETHNIKAVENSVFELLSEGIDLMAKDKIHKIAVGLSSGGTVDIKAGSGGKIALKRSVALTNKREV